MLSGHAEIYISYLLQQFESRKNIHMKKEGDIILKTRRRVKIVNKHSEIVLYYVAVRSTFLNTYSIYKWKNLAFGRSLPKIFRI